MDLVFNPKWLNKTAKPDAVRAEMKEAYNRLENDWKEIEAKISDSALKEPVFKIYSETGDKEAALNRIREYEAVCALSVNQDCDDDDVQIAEVKVVQTCEPVLQDMWLVSGTRSQLSALWQIAAEMGVKVLVR